MVSLQFGALFQNKLSQFDSRSLNFLVFVWMLGFMLAFITLLHVLPLGQKCSMLDDASSKGGKGVEGCLLHCFPIVE